MKPCAHSLVLVCLSWFLISPVTAGDEPKSQPDPMRALATKLADRLVEKERTRVTVLDFTDIQDRPNELGRYLALQLSDELVNATDVSVLDRANIATIMAEHKLTAEGLLRPEDAKKLGKFAGVDAFLLGTVSVMGDSVQVIVRAISTESSEIVASGRASLPETEEARRMLGLSVDGRTNGSSRSGGSPTTTSATDGLAIATKELGPITVTLTNVSAHSVQVQPPRSRARNVTVPAIRCTFDLENRDLRKWVAVAANQLVRKDRGNNLSSNGYRGGLADSRRVSWVLREVRGISAVAGFDIGQPMGYRLTQPNPGAVVEFIRTAQRYSGGNLGGRDRVGRHWSGSFSSIPPGESIRMTVDFIPMIVSQDKNTGPGSATSLPQYFQFDMELVLGTYVEGKDPAKAKDLVLRNLTIDRVVLPKGEGRATP